MLTCRLELGIVDLQVQLRAVSSVAHVRGKRSIDAALDARPVKKTARTGRAEGVSLTRTQGETDCRLFPVHRLHKSGERLRSGKNAQVGRFNGP